jgi:capsular exopolysaccharide synthesis family protein
LDLRDYLRILRRYWLGILTAVLLGLLAGGGASVLTRPSYAAETQLFVAIQSSGSVQDLQQGNTFSQARVQSYVKTIDSPVVLNPVIEALGLDMTSEALASRVSASTDANTVLINITVTDASAVQAAAIAQAVANSLVNAVDTLEKPQTGGTSPVRLSIIKPATAPTTPSAPNTRLNLLLGLVAGLAVGCGFAVLRSTLDNRIRGEADLRRVTDAPLLGGIAFDSAAAKSPLLSELSARSPRAEAYRQLRTNLQFANVTGNAKTILVTSSLPGEGKSTTAANLAMSLAQAGSAVCLVDADLRRPMVAEYLGLAQDAGLTTALVGLADVDDLLQQWGDDKLFVLTSGQIPPNPSELLGSEEMKGLILRLEQVFDSIVIDAPPLLPVTDAAVLSQHVGGVVLVVGAQKITTNDLERSIGSLELVDADLLGIVLNLVPAKGPDAYSYGYYSNGDSTEPSKRAAASLSISAVDTYDVVQDASKRAVDERPAKNFPLR